MKIMMISGSFYPQNSPRSFRTTELFKEFSRLGHELTLYIPQSDFNYSEWLSNYHGTIRFFKRYTERRTFTGISLLDRVIFHYENWLLDLPSKKSMHEVENAIRNESNYDLLVTIAVPHYIHWAVGKLYEKGHKIAKTWVADCGDPFMLNGTDAHCPPFWFKPLEKRWCRLCDYIAVPTETSYKGYYPEFHNKIRVIPQGFNFDDIQLPSYKKQEVPTFAFTGGLIPGKRDPRKLLEWLVSVKQLFCFHVYGNGIMPFFEPFQKKLGKKLVVHDPIPRNELLPILAQMDFLLNIGNGTNVQTPSKLIDYTLVKRPILTIESNDIKEAIFKEFLQGDYRHKDRVIDISRYDIHNVTKQFLNLCNNGKV